MKNFKNLILAGIALVAIATATTVGLVLGLGKNKNDDGVHAATGFGAVTATITIPTTISASNHTLILNALVGNITNIRGVASYSPAPNGSTSVYTITFNVNTTVTQETCTNPVGEQTDQGYGVCGGLLISETSPYAITIPSGFKPPAKPEA